jgi:hypothetical protein
MIKSDIFGICFGYVNNMRFVQTYAVILFFTMHNIQLCLKLCTVTTRSPTSLPYFSATFNSKFILSFMNY